MSKLSDFQHGTLLRLRNGGYTDEANELLQIYWESNQRGGLEDPTRLGELERMVPKANGDEVSFVAEVKLVGNGPVIEAPTMEQLDEVAHRVITSPPKDAINHPSHYTSGSIETIEVIEDWDLGFCLGNVIKYVGRADHKGKPLEDLRKAAWYLQREIEKREKE